MDAKNWICICFLRYLQAAPEKLSCETFNLSILQKHFSCYNLLVFLLQEWKNMFYFLIAGIIGNLRLINFCKKT